MRVPHLATAVAALFLLLMLASMGAHAAGKDIIIHRDVVMDNVNKSLQLPVKVADRTTAYPIMKRIGTARIATAMRYATSPTAAAAAVIAGIIMAEYDTENGTSTTIVSNNYYNDLRTFNWSSTLCNTFTGNNLSDPKAALEARCNVWAAALSPSQITYDWTFTCAGSDAYGCRNYNVTFKRKRISDGVYQANGSGGVSRPSGTYVNHTQTLYTDTQLADAVTGYSGDPNNVKDLFADHINQDLVNQAAHDPIPLSQESIDQINQAVRDGVYTGLDAFEEELAKWAREHGVEGVPDPTSVPEADKDEEGDDTSDTTVNVTVNVEPDTPGGTFTEPTLEEVGTFEATTAAFQTGLQAVPLVAAWSGITSSVPTGSCPSASFTAFGNSYDFMEVGCMIWETYAVPLISLCFLFVWPFVGLRIIMSA